MSSPQDDLSGLRPGDVLAGKYRVDRVLGMGGMGVVIAAHHVQLDEQVAIKLLLPSIATDPSAVARFLREARAAAKIKSEHVVRVFDVGTLPTGAPYMVMEFLKGSDLAQWLEERGPLSIEQATEFVLQASVAIAEAHAAGIVHRDLKPANLFCVQTGDGRQLVKVLDFGISKMASFGADAAMTKTSALMGSPLYMSPEQMQSAKEVDARTDIWSLGVILHQLVTGVMPFNGQTLPEVIFRIATEDPPPLRSVRPDAPAGLEAVVARCLQKDRGRRYSNIAELAAALTPFAPPHGRSLAERIGVMLGGTGAAQDGPPPRTPTASSPPTLPAPAPARGMTTRDAWGRTEDASPPRRRSAAFALGGAGIAVVVLGGALAMAVRYRAEHATAEPKVVTPAEASGAAVGAPVTVTAAAAPSRAPAPPSTPVPAVPAGSFEPAAGVRPAPETVPAASSGSKHRSAPSPGKLPAAPRATPAGEAPSPASNPAPAAPSPAPAPPAASPNCSPPYYFDPSTGNKVFKRECVQ